MKKHQKTIGKSDTWFTPPEIIQALRVKITAEKGTPIPQKDIAESRARIRKAMKDSPVLAVEEETQEKMLTEIQDLYFDFYNNEDDSYNLTAYDITAIVKSRFILTRKPNK